MRVLGVDDLWCSVRFSNWFAPEPGSAWMNRTLGDFELILVVRGAYRYRDTRGSDLVINKNDVLVIYPGLRHDFIQIDDAGKGIISCIHCEFSKEGTWLGQDYQLSPAPQVVTHLGEQKELVRLQFRQCERVFSGEHRHRQNLADLSATTIAVALAQSWVLQCSFIPRQRIGQIITYIRSNMSRPVSRSEIAKEFAVSETYLSKQFTQCTGMSLVKFIQREKILYAYRCMFEQGLSAKEAAYSVGFDDPAYFSRVFKSVMGLSPRQSLSGTITQRS